MDVETRPRIALPLSLDESGALRGGRKTLYLDDAYVRAIEAAGGEAAAIVPGTALEAQLAGFDGILLPGGDDFPPPSGHASAHACRPVPERQRTADQALCNAAMAGSLPILGVCYGMQLMASVAGGTLVYDLPTERPTASAHAQPGRAAVHPLMLADGSMLADLIPGDRTVVNSRHHQAVDEPGQDFRVVARSPDGVVEAIEGTGDDFRLGVQWHPEDLAGPAGEGLFCALVAAARQSAARSTSR